MDTQKRKQCRTSSRIKKPRILFFPIGDATLCSTRTRIYERTPLLEKEGLKTTILYPKQQKGKIWGKLRYLKYMIEITRHNIIYFQKQTNNLAYWQLKLAKALGKMTIYDTDDYLDRVHEKMEKMMETADITIVSSIAMSEWAKQHANICITIPSVVNTETFKPTQTPKKNQIIWIGNSSYNNLLKLLPIFYNVRKIMPYQIKIIGKIPDYIIKQLNIITTTEHIQWEKPENLPKHICESKIAIAPLDTQMKNTQYAIPTKILEYMACGTPVITDDMPATREIIVDRITGYLANTPEEWERTILYLLQQKEENQTMKETGITYIQECYSTESTAKKLAKLIIDLYYSQPKNEQKEKGLWKNAKQKYKQ